MVATNPPRALLFDVFGTVVDWRSSVTRALIAYSAAALSAPDASLPSTVRLRASTLTAEDWVSRTLYVSPSLPQFDEVARSPTEVR